jgi:hypothetical protein
VHAFGGDYEAALQHLDEAIRACGSCNYRNKAIQSAGNVTT